MEEILTLCAFAVCRFSSIDLLVGLLVYHEFHPFISQVLLSSTDMASIQKRPTLKDISDLLLSELDSTWCFRHRSINVFILV